MMMYRVKLVVFVAIDAGANPETAGLARSLNMDQGHRTFDFHLPMTLNHDELQDLYNKFRVDFILPKRRGETPTTIAGLANGPSAVRITGLELCARRNECSDINPATWSVYASWRH
jgi:hypothetical protein